MAGCFSHEILDFSASINPLGLPASALAAIQAAIAQLSAYPDPTYYSLRLALAEAHDLDPDWILPGNGAAELLTWAARDLATYATVYLPVPAFSDYWRALRAFEANVHPLALKLTSASYPHAQTGTCQASDFLPLACNNLQVQATSGLLLNNPHNPTGQLVSGTALLPFLEQAGLVVVDEAFMDFLSPDRDQSLIPYIQDYPNLVVVRSLTKFYSLPGLRLGYAIAHPDRLRRWQQWRDPWSVNALSAAVGEVVLSDRPFQTQTWEWLQQARPKLFQGLAQLPGLCPYPSAANFLLVQSEAVVPEMQLQLLQQHRVLIRDCLSFPELGDRYFRVAIRTSAENQRLLNGLADILDADGLHPTP